MHRNISMEGPRLARLKFLVLLGLSFLFFFTGEIKAQANTLYQTNFNHINDWQIYKGHPAGQWQNENGILKAKGGKDSRAILKNHRFRNFEYNAAVSVSKSAKQTQSGILFRANSTTEKIGYQGYYFGLDVPHQKVKLIYILVSLEKPPRLLTEK